MTKERLIELAKQAGWEYADDDRGFEPLWAFAELVRADERDDILRMSYSQWFKSQSAYDEAIKARSNT